VKVAQCKETKSSRNKQCAVIEFLTTKHSTDWHSLANESCSWVPLFRHQDCPTCAALVRDADLGHASLLAPSLIVSTPLERYKNLKHVLEEFVLICSRFSSNTTMRSLTSARATAETSSWCHCFEPHTVHPRHGSI
jgi:hypothetical protein